MKKFFVLFFLFANNAQAFISNQDLKFDNSNFFSATNAILADDPISIGVKYWIPTQANVTGEVVYKFSLGKTVDSASLFGEIASFRVFDSGAQSFLDVSPDGANWTNLLANTVGNFPSGSNSFQSFDGDITSYVQGSNEIWVRARLLSTLTHSSGQSFYSQFMRTLPTNVERPRLIVNVNVPEPSTMILFLFSSFFFLLRGRRVRAATA